ncbi:MAG: hypothetical protein AAFZ87_04065 [Planctomycetota bacterium]
MANYNECRNALVSTDIENEWNELLATLPDEEQQHREPLLAWIRTIRDETVELIDDIAALDSSPIHLALRFVELRAQWAMTNTRLNFKVLKGKPLDHVLAFRASLISSVSYALEQQLAPSDLEVISRFLADPVSKDYSRITAAA